MKVNGKLLITSRIAVALMSGIWLATGTGCPTPPVPDDNVNDNVDDNVNDNVDDNVNDNDNAPPEVDLFRTSTSCVGCHGGLTDSEGNDVSIDAHWESTMMANAAVEPLFQASVSSEVERAPALREIIEDKCAKCHLPMAYTQADTDGTSTLIFDDGLLNPADPLYDEAIDGVSCTLCHQITNAFLDDPEASFGGEYTVDTATQQPDRPDYGPFPQPQQADVMQAASGFLPVYGPHIEEAGLCATCHTLFTPTLDAAGEVVGEFPEQVAFFEWLHSDFGDGLGDDDRTCQGCHMPVAEGPAPISSIPGGLDPRSPFFQHHFVGGNVFMLRLMRDNRSDLDLPASTENFNATIARTEQLLGNAADLMIADARLGGGTLEVTLEITSQAGHKFPTGFPSRRAWIHLTVTDASETVVFESGAAQPDGSITGNDADENAATFEPHREVLTTADDVQIYESIMANTDSEVTYTLLRAAVYAKDNRLLPLGFDKATAEDDIAVAGNAAGDENFIGGSDQVMYRVEVDEADGPFTVTAELLYQSASYRYVMELREDSTPLIDSFGSLYDAADQTPALIATAEMTLP